MMLLTQLKMAGLALSAIACVGLGGVVLAYQATAQAIQDVQNVPAAIEPAERLIDPFRFDPTPAKTPKFLRTLEMRVRAAVGSERNLQKKYQLDAVPLSVLREAQTSVQLLESEAQTQMEDLTDQVDLLEIQLEIKKARSDLSAMRLKEAEERRREVGQVPAAEKEFVLAFTESAITKAEVREVETRIKQAKRRIDGMLNLFKMLTPPALKLPEAKPEK
jgi:hypothetical protein